MFNSPLSRLITKKTRTSQFTRKASSFVPSTTTQLEPLPKPPSTNWFTTHPALSDSFAHLDSLIHRSRQNLYSVQVLKRYSASPDFSGTGIRSKWLKWKMLESQSNGTTDPKQQHLFKLLWGTNQIKWHQLATMSLLVQENENRKLKMIEYSHLTDRLNELKSLKKYLIIVKSLQLDKANLEEINKLDSQIEHELLKYSVPEHQASLTKRQPIERDHLGRFSGMGRKKESSARAWMIEVKIPDSILSPVEASSSVLPSEPPSSPSSSSSSSSSNDDPIETLVANPTETNTIETNSTDINSTEAKSTEIKSTETNSTETEKVTQDHLFLPLGKIMINGRSIVDYFHTPRQRATAIRPLEMTNCVGHYNIHILVHGGGKMGQAAAASHAISNCLLKALNEAGKTDGSAKERFAKKVLLKSHLTLRDPRVVERKKTGKPGAKSSYRWVKR
ncbi:hypothetical protein MJO28_012357 [Puccinia striiformis f. sp. tritici]|nr:hypothetical protein MJO28_012357 [Puccinia striiformis f. sp. tritici]KAI9605894.1 hypothetical protein H4Q26_004264 [Puccinia striiformis f. sp. tritici PST-130]POW20602.1 hypothetical protein PSHT_03374 [Puccinia striiformis]